MPLRAEAGALFVAAALAILALPLAALAAPTAGSLGEAAPKRFAIVVGNGDYATAPDLRNARADAELVADFLGEQGYSVTEFADLDKAGFERDAPAHPARDRQGQRGRLLLRRPRRADRRRQLPHPGRRRLQGRLRPPLRGGVADHHRQRPRRPRPHPDRHPRQLPLEPLRRRPGARRRHRHPERAAGRLQRPDRAGQLAPRLLHLARARTPTTAPARTAPSPPPSSRRRAARPRRPSAPSSRRCAARSTPAPRAGRCRGKARPWCSRCPSARPRASSSPTARAPGAPG